jgi:hypothetical protein
LAATLGQSARRRALDFCSKSRMIEAHASAYARVFGAARQK